MSSELMEFKPEGGCRTSAGSYYLPKTHLKVEVKRHTETDTAAAAATAFWHQIEITSIRVPDRHFGYCLDYLGRINTDDIVNVQRYARTQLLGLVSTDAIDQSGAIISTLVRAVLGGFAGRARSTKTTSTVTVFVADYDPFDKAATAQVNDALRQFGFCLLLDADYAGDWRKINGYCNRPSGGHDQRSHHAQEPYQVEYRDRLPPDRKSLQGIFYRPRVPYHYYLFVRDNPETHGPWQLREQTVVHLENAAPILAARLDRAFFAQRKTTLIFDEGTLKNVCVYKTSELEQVSLVTLDVVKSIVALPAQTIQIQIDNVKGSNALSAAELELLKTQKSYSDLLSNPKSESHKGSKVSSPFQSGGKDAIWAVDENLRIKRPTAAIDGWEGACPTARTAESKASNAVGGIAQ